MKVTREEGFKPITIVLETKEEAATMYHALNNPFKSYIASDVICGVPWPANMFELKSTLFWKYANVVNPK